MKNQENIDPIELNKFAEMANYWWDREGPCKPLHDINPIRLAYIKENATLKGKTILDVGCGGGLLSESLAASGAEVTAIDMNSKLIEVAKAHAASSKLAINYQHISINELAEKSPETYDIVTCMELLEHVPDPGKIIADCATCLKPGGKLFVATLNRTYKSYLFAIIGAEYILNLVPKETHNYDKFVQPSELEQWARNSNLSLTNLSGLSYNPLTKHYFPTDDISVNYMGMCEKQ